MADDESVKRRLERLIAEHPILIFMKGSPDFPRCGFSARAVETLRRHGVRTLPYVDVLADPDVRRVLPTVSDWPTFPQVFVRGELVGGADVLGELEASGELRRLLAGLTEEDAAGGRA
jgi:monothiol glutaredoxin